MQHAMYINHYSVMCSQLGKKKHYTPYIADLTPPLPPGRADDAAVAQSGGGEGRGGGISRPAATSRPALTTDH